MESRPDSPAAERDDQAIEFAQPRVIQSEELLLGAKEVLIAHHGQVYRLRETRNGKLILSK